MIGTVLDGGYRLTEALYEGMWLVYRGTARDGNRVLVTIAPTPNVMAELALPFKGVPALRATVPVKLRSGAQWLAVIESEPAGRCVADLSGPVPLDEVFTVGLDLARLLQTIHAAGAFHGSLRPQMTWVEHTYGQGRPGGRLSLSGSSPRSERFGTAGAKPRSSGQVSPFIADLFLPDVLARGEPAGVASDIAQLGMMLHRLATGRSPFHRGDSPMPELVRAMNGETERWGQGDPRAKAAEEVARAAFDPDRRESRSLSPILRFLEEQAR